MAYEDWTDGGIWTEIDGDADLTVAANTITVTTMRRGAEACLIGDYGVAKWGGDFDIDVTSFFDISASDDTSSFAIIGMTDNPAVRTIEEMNAANHGWCLWWYHQNGTEAVNVCLRCWITNNEDCHGYAGDNETYYITMIRTGATLEAELYTDAARTVLHDTLTITEGVNTFRYMLNAMSYETPGNFNDCTGWVKNLDFKVAPAESEYFGPTFDLVGSTVTITFPYPEWGTPDNRIDKTVDLLDFWDNDLDTIDKGISAQPLVLSGTVCRGTGDWETYVETTTWLDSIKTAMNDGEEFTISELGNCLNGVYVIKDFTFNTIKKSALCYEWSLNLERVRDV